MTDIAFPTLSAPAPDELDWGPRANTQVFTSPLNGSVQTLELPGTRWVASFRYRGLESADAALLQAFVMKLRGQGNRALVPVFDRPTARGTWSGTPVVDNELGSPSLTQTGNTLEVSGFDPFATVKAGDYFKVNGELKMATEDATADSNGTATLTFEPPLRASPAHGAALTTSSLTVRMILTDPEQRWMARPGDDTSFSFDFVEVFE